MSVFFWFRRDLRLHDNPGLAAAQRLAQQRGVPLQTCYLATPQQWVQHDMAPRQADLLERRLNALGQELADQNERFRDRLAEVFFDWLELFANCLRQAQQNGTLDPRLDAALFTFAPAKGMKVEDRTKSGVMSKPLMQ